MTIYDERIWTKSYDSFVKPKLEYPTEDLGTIFTRSMEEFADKPACWFMAREISFGELLDMVKCFATFLQKNGLEKGDVVAINLPNCPQYMVAHFGTLLAGGVASGCSPLLSDDEIAYQLNDSSAKFLITLDKVYAEVTRKILGKVPNLKCVITTNVSEYMGFSKIKVFLGKLLNKIPKGKVKPYPGKKIIWFKDVMLTSIDVKKVDIDINNDLALLQYTGGTTGRPKGTELTHFNQISNLHQIATWMNLKKGEDISLSAFPMFHAAGLAFCQTTVWLSGPQVLIPDPRATKHIIEEIIDKKPTLIVNVPTLYINISTSPEKKKIPINTLKNVKLYISGAAPFPAESIRDFEKAMQGENKLLEVYGMTETSPILTMNPKDGPKKVGTVGLPVPDTDIKLVDVETGEPVEMGQAGEILCKGPQVSKGYHNKPEANKKTLTEDGYLRTGDVGVMDEDGYFKIVDRTKDMLIVSGFKVYSVHVEDVLTKHPDVEICALIGVKDPKRPGSEIVKAVIQLKEGKTATEAVKESLQKYAEEHLSKYEKPKMWEFREELPLTTIGKVLKRELREEKK
ncbi:MAG: AMP-binding protein [Promethearchaeota archaeon]